MPDCPAPYLVELLLEAGPVQASGMGVGAVTWGELESWQRQTGLQLQPWEVRLLRELSRAYAVQLDASQEPDCPSPIEVEPSKEQRADVARGLSNSFRALMAAQKATPSRKTKRKK
jgi:hypothetical protein